MRYYKGHIALSDARDVPVLLHIRNARAICFDQLHALLSFGILTEVPRSLRWRLARLEKAGLVMRLAGQQHLVTPVFGITQQRLIFLESRGHFLLSLPSTTELVLHPTQVPHALEMVNIRVALAKAGVVVGFGRVETRLRVRLDGHAGPHHAASNLYRQAPKRRCQ